MFLRNGWAALVAAMVLAACGGRSSPEPPEKPRTTAVKVVGGNFSDSGTAGFKLTVQGTPAYPIWTDHVAAAVGAPALCPRYRLLAGALVLDASAAACTSYGAITGAINPAGVPNDTRPMSILQQLKDLSASGPYHPDELLLVEAGGNDFAELVRVATLAPWDGGAALLRLGSEWLTAGERAGLAMPDMGEAYAIRLANRLADSVTTQALDRGAQRVLLLTVPDMTRTPKSLAMLAWAEKRVRTDGGDGTAAVADIQSQVRRWTTAFNQRLKARFAGQGRVLVVDLDAELERWLDMPGAYGWTESVRPACPIAGVDPSGIANYNITTCTDILLNATPPVGASGPDWWKTYVFADDFHLTPRAHEWMGAAVVKALEAKGWR